MPGTATQPVNTVLGGIGISTLRMATSIFSGGRGSEVETDYIQFFFFLSPLLSIFPSSGFPFLASRIMTGHDHNHNHVRVYMYIRSSNSNPRQQKPICPRKPGIQTFIDMDNDLVCLKEEPPLESQISRVNCCNNVKFSPVGALKFPN